MATIVRATTLLKVFSFFSPFSPFFFSLLFSLLFFSFFYFSFTHDYCLSRSNAELSDFSSATDAIRLKDRSQNRIERRFVATRALISIRVERDRSTPFYRLSSTDYSFYP